MNKFVTLILGLSLLTMYTMGQNRHHQKAHRSDHYNRRMKEFRRHPIGKDKIVFLGNSLTQNGLWDEYFPKQQPVNRGISGDNTDGVLARIDEIAIAKPKKLFIMGGINDISQNQTNDAIITNLETIVSEVLRQSPKTKIYIQSVLPINNSFKRYSRLTNKEGQIEKLNKDLQKLCKKYKITFINLYSSFLQKKQKQTLEPQYTNDGLHLNSDGYNVWVKLIRKHVE